MQLTYLVDFKTGEVWDDDLGWNKKKAAIKTPEQWTQVEHQYNGHIYKAISKSSQFSWQDRKYYCLPVVPFIEFEVLC